MRERDWSEIWVSGRLSLREFFLFWGFLSIFPKWDKRKRGQGREWGIREGTEDIPCLHKWKMLCVYANENMNLPYPSIRKYGTFPNPWKDFDMSNLAESSLFLFLCPPHPPHLLTLSLLNMSHRTQNHSWGGEYIWKRMTSLQKIWKSFSFLFSFLFSREKPFRV